MRDPRDCTKVKEKREVSIYRGIKYGGVDEEC